MPTVRLSTSSKRSGKAGSALGAVIGGLVSFGLSLAGGWILYSRFFIDHHLPLPAAIPAERREFGSKQAGRLSFYVDKQGEGRPLVLIHSVNAAASAYEMLPIFQRTRGRRPVFALDLPGYGFSERAARPYTPQTFVQAILEFLDTQVGQPADVVALSLGSEFAALAAMAAPDRFHSLVLISPSGLSKPGSVGRSQGAASGGTADRAYRFLAFPLWTRALFDLIATRASINYFLKRSFVGPVDGGLADYGYITAHQPGAEHVPLHFISGRLFTPDIKERAYKQLPTPTLVLYDRDNFVRFDALPEVLEANNKWRAVRISPTLGLPQFEKMDDVAEALNDFWQSLG